MRPDLQAAWDRAGKMGFATRKPPGLDVIEPALGSTEKVLSILRGWRSGSQPCSIVLTDRQLYFFSYAGVKFISNQEVAPFGNINGVELKQNAALLGLEVKITRANNVDRITNVDKTVAQEFVTKLQECISNRTSGSTTVIQNQTLDPLDQLKKLKDLLESGIITQAEFDQKKQTLLDQI